MKKTISALGALAVGAWVLSASAPTAWAVNTIMDATTQAGGPTNGNGGQASEIRDGGPSLTSSGGFLWENQGTNVVPPTGGTDPPSNYPLPANPEFHIDAAPGAVWGGSGPEAGNAGQGGRSGFPAGMDGTRKLFMSAAGTGVYNQYVGGLGSDTQEYMKVTFRSTWFNNNNGGTTTNGPLDSSTNHGDGIIALQLQNGPAIGVDVYNYVTATPKDRYVYNLFKFHPSQGGGGPNNYAPIQNLGAFPNDANGDGGTTNDDTTHTLEMFVDSATDAVRVAWDGVKVFDGTVGAWANTGTPFLDSTSSVAYFGARMTLINSGNGNKENAAYSLVQLASAVPVGSPLFVPEPSTFVLAGLGLLGLVGYARRRKV